MLKNKVAKNLLAASSVIVLLCVALNPRVGGCDNSMDLLIVANKSVPLSKISIEELKSIFFRAKTTWPGGDSIEPIHAPSGSQGREMFSHTVLGMSHRDELRKWEDLRIMKGLSPPPEFSSKEHERMRTVFKTPNSISYVFRKDFVPGVSKILLVLPYEAISAK